MLAGLKKNQPTLLRFAQALVHSHKAHCSTARELDKEKGGPVEREYFALDARAGLARSRRGAVQEWRGLIATFVKVRRSTADGFEDRYYICNRKIDASEAARLVRGHWHVENKLHLTLDRCLGEDASRRSRFAGARAQLHALAHNLLRRLAPRGWAVQKTRNAARPDRILAPELGFL